jgi:hypothetical protein
MEREERREELERMSEEETPGGEEAARTTDRGMTAPEPRHAPGEPDIIAPPPPTAPAEPEVKADEPSQARGPHGEMAPSGTVPPPPTDRGMAAERVTSPREPPPPPPPPSETPAPAYRETEGPAEEGDSRGRRILAIVLIALGVWLLADQFLPGIGRLWPIILIVVGILLLYRRR